MVFGSYSINLLDSDTPMWTEVAIQGSSPSPRSSASAVLNGDNMYIYGGADMAAPYNDIFAFSFSLYLFLPCFHSVCLLSLENRTWTQVSVHGKCPAPILCDHTAVVYGFAYFADVIFQIWPSFA